MHRRVFLSPRRGIFEEPAGIPEYRFQSVRPDIHRRYREAGRANHWRSVPLATVPGFGQPRRLVPLGRFPSRNFGGRTSIVMRSMLHRVLILSSSRPGDASGRETRAVSARLVRPKCLAIVLRSPQLPPPTPTGPPGRARLVLVIFHIFSSDF